MFVEFWTRLTRQFWQCFLSAFLVSRSMRFRSESAKTFIQNTLGKGPLVGQMVCFRYKFFKYLDFSLSCTAGRENSVKPFGKILWKMPMEWFFSIAIEGEAVCCVATAAATAATGLQHEWATIVRAPVSMLWQGLSQVNFDRKLSIIDIARVLQRPANVHVPEINFIEERCSSPMQWGVVQGLRAWV